MNKIKKKVCKTCTVDNVSLSRQTQSEVNILKRDESIILLKIKF